MTVEISVAHAALMSITDEERRSFLDECANYRADAGEDDCWIWGGNVAKHGYGSCQIGKRPQTVHRVSLFIASGRLPLWTPDPNSECAAHSCRSRLCFNPRHLSWKTNHENHSEDKVRDDAQPKGEDNPNHVYKDSQFVEARRLLETTAFTGKEISKQSGLSVQMVKRMTKGDYLHRTGSERPITRPPLYEDTKHCYRLTEDDVLAIRNKLRTTLFSAKVIAEEHGCDASNVQYILDGKIHTKTPDGRERSPLRREAIEEAGLTRAIRCNGKKFAIVTGNADPEELRRAALDRKAELQRGYDAAKTPEEKAAWNKARYAREKAKRETMTPEEVAAVKAANAERARRSREKRDADPEARAAHLKARRERLEAEDPETRAARLARKAELQRGYEAAKKVAPAEARELEQAEPEKPVLAKRAKCLGLTEEQKDKRRKEMCRRWKKTFDAFAPKDSEAGEHE